MSFIEFTTIKKGIAQVSLNRPEVHNAFNAQLLKDLLSTFKKIENDPAIRVVILRGNGKNFSAGADLEWMRQMVHYSQEENYEDALLLANTMHHLNTLSKPTIALIQGHVLGGGVGLVCCCDIALASAQAQFCFSEVKLGLIPAVISPYVIDAIGTRMTRRYFLTAERIDAQTARDIHLIHEVLDEEKLIERALEIAQSLMQNSPLALTAAKDLIFTAQRCHLDEMLRQETSRRIAKIRTSSEAQEGMQAFLQKRIPNWMKDDV